MLNSPLIAHHPTTNPYSLHSRPPRFMSSSSQRPLYSEWPYQYGLSVEPSSPPAPVGPPLLEPHHAQFFDQLLLDMPNSMIPSIDPSHVFDPDIKDPTPAWPDDSSIPRNYVPPDSSGVPLSSVPATTSYYTPTAQPHLDVNPFTAGHHVLHRPQQTQGITAPSLLNFGTDTNFAPNGYNPPAPPPAQLHIDKDTEIKSKILSALTKNESAYTTPTAVSPANSRSGSPGAPAHPIADPATGSKRRASSASAKPTKKQKPNGTGRRDNLTEAQKRENHIHSEQKRRNLIRQGFEELSALVPELKAGGYSKSAVLVHAANYLEDLKKGNLRLRSYLAELERARGLPVSVDLGAGEMAGGQMQAGGIPGEMAGGQGGGGMAGIPPGY